jgi:hypothetical protein
VVTLLERQLVVVDVVAEVVVEVVDAAVVAVSEAESVEMALVVLFVKEVSSERDHRH